MLNTLDLLIIVVLALTAASLVSLVLLFLVRNKTVKRICLYLVIAFAIYIGYAGIRINLHNDLPRTVLAAVMGAVAIGGFVMERRAVGDERKLLTARILASVALVAGMLNAFL